MQAAQKHDHFLGLCHNFCHKLWQIVVFFVNVNNMILNAKYGGCSPSTLHIWINLILDRSVRDISLLHR